MNNRIAAVLAAILALGAVPGIAQTMPDRVAPLAPSEKLPNLDKLKDELKQYHACTCACGCYAKDLDLEADRAIAFLDRRAAHNTKHEKLALVLDIDETTLSNYSEMEKQGFAYDAKSFNAWAQQAAATAIPGTLRLVKEAQKLGVAVIFLTGRPDGQRAATARNLAGQGFTGYKELRMRAAADAKSSAIAFKSAQRAQVVGEGYTIVESVGDQWSDLRGKPQAEYSVKYPNPYYFIP
ncbi:MAG TPA: HAD family acid phosphatase [Terracidiphilus sp.]|nr:HAD family acid phosphatase [Terracidiphilus sp.]